MNENIDKPTMKLPPLKRMCMTIGQLPSSYVESMSYYEMLVWFIHYLRDEVIPVVNANGEAVEELQELYIQLQEYVNNYFDNLDVQEEINNKLDDMAESGQLTDIIAQYLGLAGMIAFNNVAEMKAALNLVNGSKCATLGYYEVNDKGNSFYKIREVTNEDVIDEMFIIALNDNNLIAELIVQNELNVKQVGIYEDDTHDDSDKLISLISKNVSQNFKIKGNNSYCKVTKTIDIPCYSNIEDLWINFYAGSYVNNYAIYVNANDTHNGWKQAYPFNFGNIKNCVFINKTNTDFNCIYNYSNDTFEKLRFSYFDVSFKNTTSYLDLVSLKDIIVENGRGSNYAVDLGYLGDAVSIDKMIMSGTKRNLLQIGEGHNGVTLNNVICNGIININGGNVTFNNLHQESSPSIIINKAIVKITNSYLNHNLNEDEYNFDISNHSHVILENILINYGHQNLIDNSTNDRDINISVNSTLEINNVFKRFATNDINTKDLDNIKVNSIITMNNKQLYNPSGFDWLTSCYGTNQINNNHSPQYAGNSSATTWKIATGTYYYCIVPIMDIERKIKYSGTPTKYSASKVNGESGYVITTLGGLYRFYRGTSENTYDSYVDVAHFNGSLYDDGIYLNGSKWLSRTAGDIDDFNLSSKVTYNSENVTSYFTSIPTYGAWKRGDIVYNTDGSSDTRGWICVTGGTPGTWKQL